MNAVFVDILKKLIAEQGKEALLNPVKCKAFLADYTKGEYKKESRLLLQALDVGVQKAVDAAEDLEICKMQQIKALREEHFLDIEVAADVVDTLTVVLRKEQEKETSQGTFCANCGKELQKEWTVCPYCGTAVAKTQPEPPKTEQQPSPAPIEQTPPSTSANIQTPSAPLKKNNAIRNIVLVVLGILVIIGIVRIASEYSNATASDQIFFNRGLTYSYKGDYDNAITQFTEVIRQNPNDTLTYYKRGEAYRMKGQYEMAIKDFSKAVSLSNYAWAYARRGQAYKELGQRDRAIQDLEKAISLDPNFYLAKQELQKIRGY
jgi:tetratricopeptide (TPR) repeat protein